MGAYAFADCEKLVKLDIADSVQTIGAFAYFNNRSKNSLTSIGDGMNCTFEHVCSNS